MNNVGRISRLGSRLPQVNGIDSHRIIPIQGGKCKMKVKNARL